MGQRRPEAVGARGQSECGYLDDFFKLAVWEFRADVRFSWPIDRPECLARARAPLGKNGGYFCVSASVIFSLLGVGSASSVDAAEGCQHLGGACVPALCSNSQRLADRSVL